MLDCADTLVVGDRWTMMIVRDVFFGICRFDAMQQDLGLTPHRLSNRLAKLVRDGSGARQYEEHPHRFEYRLTEKGIDLFPLIVVLNSWGDRWMAGPAGAPIELVHRNCGRAIKPALTCPSCKEKMVPREMKLRPAAHLTLRTAWKDVSGWVTAHFAQHYGIFAPPAIWMRRMRTRG